MNGETYYITDDAIGDELGNMGLELDTEIFCSAYFDGEYLYWSAYRASENAVTLMVMDTLTGRFYNMGSFDDGVWPIAGLMELNAGTNLHVSSATLGTPQKLDSNATLERMERHAPEKMGELQSMDLRLSDGGYDEKNGKVDVLVTPVVDATNGRLVVTYDPAKLRLNSDK